MNYTYEIDTINNGVTITRFDCLYEGSVNIPSTIEDLPVTKIADSAFQYCDKIVSVMMPSTVTYIGDYAFCDCASLSSINLPSGLISLGTHAFENCGALSSINIPSGITEIKASTFENCKSLNITIPDTITSVAEKAFYETGLTTLAISSTLTSIGAGAFGCLLNLESIALSADNTAFVLEDNILYNSDKTTLKLYPNFKSEENFTIPDNVIQIENFAFCSSALKNFYLNSSITLIPDLCDCTCLESIGIPEGITNEHFDFQYGTDYLVWQSGDNKLLIKAVSTLSDQSVNTSGILYLLSNNEYCINSGVSPGCFNGCRLFHQITIKIGSNTSIFVPFKAFKGCTELRNFILSSTSSATPENITYVISSRCFEDCTNLSVCAVSSRINLIFESHCFDNCNNLSGIQGNGIISVAQYKSFTTGNGCIYFMGRIWNTYGFKVITPDGYTVWKNQSINSYLGTFINNYPNIQEWTFGQGLQNIPHLNLNSHIKKLTFPSTVVNISVSAFENINADEIDLSSCDIESVPLYAFKNANIGRLNMSLCCVTSISRYAFQNTSIKNFLFNWNTLRKIEAYAFDNTTFSENNDYKITIDCGNEDTSFTLDHCSFYNCKNLYSINIIINKGTFTAGTTSNPSIYGIFSNTQVDSINIDVGDTVTCTLGNNIFKNMMCNHFQTSIKNISSGAFSSMSFKTLTLPNASNIGEEAFYYCAAEIITISNVSSIGSRAFKYCTVKNLSIDWSNVTYIGEEAFSNFTFPKNYYINIDHSADEEKALTIGSEAFYYSCNLLKFSAKLHSESSGHVIGSRCFYGSMLSELEITGSVSSIDSNAFDDAKYLQKAHVPVASVSSCGMLRELIFEPSPIEFSESLIKNTRCLNTLNLRALSIEKLSITYYSQYETLNNLILPDTIKTITLNQRYALTSLKVPDSVTSISIGDCPIRRLEVKEDCTVKGYQGDNYFCVGSSNKLPMEISYR